MSKIEFKTLLVFAYISMRYSPKECLYCKHSISDPDCGYTCIFEDWEHFGHKTPFCSEFKIDYKYILNHVIIFDLYKKLYGYMAIKNKCKRKIYKYLNEIYDYNFTNNTR
jgi:hypothetical protein